MVTKNEILKLAGTQSPLCISIFIPTHRAGEETYNNTDAISLKNQLKDVKQKIEQHGIDIQTIEKILKPAEDLLADGNFWRNQSDGLALYISEDDFKHYTVPIPFKEYNYVGNEFYIKPLLPIFNADGIFYIITLKKDKVKLYEGAKYSISELVIEDVIPNQMEDRVGYDYEEKNLQFRTQQGNQGKGMYHGHGDNSSDEKKELLQYFKSVNDGIMCVIGDNQNPPLIICSQDHLYGIYKEANKYNNLYDKHIAINPDDIKTKDLHAEAIELLQPYFKSEKGEKAALFGQYIGTGKASSNVKDIIPYAVQGLVDTLFIKEDAETFGKYDLATNKVEINDNKTNDNISLVNLAAVKVFEQGGSVFFVSNDEMPDKSSDMNVVYRTTL